MIPQPRGWFVALLVFVIGLGFSLSGITSAQEGVPPVPSVTAPAASPAPSPAAAPKIDKGDTAWILTSAALVLMMTLPGLALFSMARAQRRK